MAKFRKKPVVVEAVQFLGKESVAEVLDFTDFTAAAAAHKTDSGDHIPVIEIKTLEGTMVASPGDWIIRGVKGEIYPRKPDIFAATYEPA